MQRDERRTIMRCPVCRSNEHVSVVLHARGLATNIVECRVCGTIWAVNHGTIEIVRDTQEKSFLEGLTECVERDDYFLVA
jgi:uncharacterized Zn finger protein